MLRNIFKKWVVIGIFVLLIGTCAIPNITGYSKNSNNQLTKKSSKILSLNNDDYVNVYWKFDEGNGDNVGDSSGHNYDGTRYGASWTSDGYSGGALLFDGVDDYIDFSSHSGGIMFNKTDDIILSFYFKSLEDGLIFSSTASWGYSPEFRIELLPNGSLLFYKITQICGIILYSNGVYNDGDWHHAVYYFNGISTNPTLTLYVDGELDVCFTHWLCEIENDDYAKTKIGMHAHTTTDFFKGYVDEFKMIKYEQGNDQQPPIISGPTCGEQEIEYDYNFVTDDPENDDIWLYIDWDDGTCEEWIGPYDSGDEVIVSHKWCEEGKYNITARSKDIWHHSSLSEKYVVRIGNQAPNPPTIDGPRCDDPGVELTYSFETDDFEGHDVFYYIDWGDGTFEDWFGPFTSGEVVTASHTWEEEGEYEIKARAKDYHEYEGEWSEAYLIKIGNKAPEAPDINGPFSGSSGKEYDYKFVSSDPDGDNVIYEIKWGDGTIDVKGPFASGEEITVSHTWEKSGTYKIESRAEDEFCGFFSDYSEFEVKIPRSRNCYPNILSFLIDRFPLLRHILGLKF